MDYSVDLSGYVDYVISFLIDGLVDDFNKM